MGTELDISRMDLIHIVSVAMVTRYLGGWSRNLLPENIRQSDTLIRFKTVIKTHLFKLAYLL